VAHLVPLQHFCVVFGDLALLQLLLIELQVVFLCVLLGLLLIILFHFFEVEQNLLFLVVCVESDVESEERGQEDQRRREDRYEEAVFKLSALHQV